MKQRFITIISDVINRLQVMNPNGTTLLDIGTGYGTALSVAVNIGLSVTGIEPSDNLYRAAKQLKIGRVLRTTFDNYVNHSSEQFDFILAIHVIEHLRNPQKFLEQAFKKLKPGGVLYIETPNVESHLLRWEGVNYTFLTPPDHIHLFTPSATRFLSRTIRPSQYVVRTYSHPEHLIGILRLIKSHFFGKSRSKSSQKIKIEGFGRQPTTPADAMQTLPFFDRYIAPLLTPLLNWRNQGSILQVFIQK